MKGLILAGGSGSRLYPMTAAVSKQLLPIYDKPMIYYPISTLMIAGIRDILLISTPQDTPRFEQLLGNGSQWGINLQYAVQPSPRGIAEAFIIGKTFIGNGVCSLILGDNLFFGNDLSSMLQSACSKKEGATVFAYKVNRPQRYGVIEFNTQGKAISIEEKPEKPKSRYVVTGMYVYDHNVVDIAHSLVPSERGELEITHINAHYLKQNQLHVEVMSRGMAWLDTGTSESLIDASLFIQTIQKRQGVKIACLEEIAYRLGYIGSQDLEKQISQTDNSSYKDYLREILEEAP